MPNINKIAKLRNKLREAEERGFTTALDMMQEVVDFHNSREVDLIDTLDEKYWARKAQLLPTLITVKINQLRNCIA